MYKWKLDNTVDAIQINSTVTRGGLTTAAIVALSVAIAVWGISHTIPTHYSPIVKLDEHGQVHELTYAGKPVRMLTASEVPMDNDGGNEKVSMQ
jgi:hypothetical protein